MPKPKPPRNGQPEASAGRPIVAGVAPFAREITSRASESELWAAIEAMATSTAGFKRTNTLHKTQLTNPAKERLRAFVLQARHFYTHIRLFPPSAKPLIAYYFMLNLTKAFLTASEPKITEGKMVHGLSSSVMDRKEYSFDRETFKIFNKGVLPELAKRTGSGHYWKDSRQISIKSLLPYLPDGYTAYSDTTERSPKLVPIKSIRVLFGGKRAWLRVEIDSNCLNERGLGPYKLLKQAKIFCEQFYYVGIHGKVATYESRKEVQYKNNRREVLRGICKLYDETLIACNRSFPHNRQYVVLSDRSELLSHEAVMFAVMYHLSDIVRYRPYDGDKIMNSEEGWLLHSWVDSASESFLLNMASRITGLEHVIV